MKCHWLRIVNFEAGDYMKEFIGALILGASFVLVLSIGGSGYEFGSKVASNDVDKGLPLQPFNEMPIIRYLDRLSDGYGANDIVYLDIISPSAGDVDEGDIRLSAFGHFTPGTQVKVNDPDYGAKLRDFINPGFVFLGVNDFAGYDYSDPVYAVADLGMQRIQANDLRLTTVNGLAAGSKVLDLNPDNGKPFTEMPAWWSYMYYGLSPHGYGIGDKIYIHIQPTALNVMENDIRISA